MTWAEHPHPETRERIWTAADLKPWGSRWFMVRVVPEGAMLFTADHKPPWVSDGRVYATVAEAQAAAEAQAGPQGAARPDPQELRAWRGCPAHAAEHRCSQAMLVGSCNGLGHAWSGCDACASALVAWLTAAGSAVDAAVDNSNRPVLPGGSP